MKFDQFDKPDAAPGTFNIDHTIVFPLCGNYLINWMNPSTLSGKSPRVWNAFVKWCGSDARASEACTWGSGPLVEINSRVAGHAYGRYKHANTVFIHAQVAAAYENGTGWMVWEAVVLHEVTHWARFQQRLYGGPGIGPDEFGNQFEIEAYGQKVKVGMWRPGP